VIGHCILENSSVQNTFRGASVIPPFTFKDVCWHGFFLKHDMISRVKDIMQRPFCGMRKKEIRMPKGKYCLEGMPRGKWL